MGCNGKRMREGRCRGAGMGGGGSQGLAGHMQVCQRSDPGTSLLPSTFHHYKRNSLLFLVNVVLH